MKTSNRTTVTVGIDLIREIVASTICRDIGEGDSTRVVFHVGEKDDGYGFPESDTVVLQKATLTIIGKPVHDRGLDMVTETTVEMNEAEVVRAIASYVGDRMKSAVDPSEVKLRMMRGHRGDHGYEAPCLEEAVVTVKVV